MATCTDCGEDITFAVFHFCAKGKRRMSEANALRRQLAEARHEAEYNFALYQDLGQEAAKRIDEMEQKCAALEATVAILKEMNGSAGHP